MNDMNDDAEVDQDSCKSGVEAKPRHSRAELKTLLEFVEVGAIKTPRGWLLVCAAF